MKLGKNKQVIMNLIDAVANNDVERIQSFFSDHSTLRNLNGTLLVGQQAIWDYIHRLHDKVREVDWQLDHICEEENGNVAAQGRIRYRIGNKWREFETNGVFEVSGSKVTRWH